MKKILRIFLYIFLTWTLVGIVSKTLFLLMYRSLMTDASWSDIIQIFAYGLRLDVAIAGYLTLVPGLVLLVCMWYRGLVLKRFFQGYFVITTFLYSLAVIANLGLYGYWGFPLDNTPLLYIRTSPADALASMTAWQLILAPLAILVATVLLYFVFNKITAPLYKNGSPRHSLVLSLQSLVVLLLTGLLDTPLNFLRTGLLTGLETVTGGLSRMILNLIY